MSSIIYKSIDSVEKKHQNRHEPYEFYRQEAVPRSEGGQMVAAFYEIPPHKSNFPYHYHEKNAEFFYIISGVGIFRTCDGDIAIKAGDTLFCPPGEKSAHKITNTSDSETLRYLDVDTTISPETAYYPDSGKTGFLKFGQPSEFYLNGKRVDYYEGEGLKDKSFKQ